MLLTYPEPQGRAGAAGGRPERNILTALFFYRIRRFLGSDVSEDPDSALYYRISYYNTLYNQQYGLVPKRHMDRFTKLKTGFLGNV